MVILFIYKSCTAVNGIGGLFLESTTQLEVHFGVMHMLREDLPNRVFKCQIWVSLLALTWGVVSSGEKLSC